MLIFIEFVTSADLELQRHNSKWQRGNIKMLKRKIKILWDELFTKYKLLRVFESLGSVYYQNVKPDDLLMTTL